MIECSTAQYTVVLRFGVQRYTVLWISEVSCNEEQRRELQCKLRRMQRQFATSHHIASVHHMSHHILSCELMRYYHCNYGYYYYCYIS